MRILATLLASLLLAACSTTSTTYRPHTPVAGASYGFQFTNRGGDDAEGIAELERVIRQHLQASGLLAAAGEGAGTIDVTLGHYYVRSNAARFLVGVMAGRDKITSLVRVLDADGSELGSYQVESTNATALGSTGGLHEKHAREILDVLR